MPPTHQISNKNSPFQAFYCDFAPNSRYKRRFYAPRSGDLREKILILWHEIV